MQELCTIAAWGRASRPLTEGTELLYSGITGGARISNNGGPDSYLCLRSQRARIPEGYSRHTRSHLYGTEYETDDHLHNHNAPCAVCYTATRSATMLIPGKINCPPLWTQEYYGYLMSTYHSHNRVSSVCVDEDSETIPGTGANIDGLYSTSPSLCALLKSVLHM